MDPNERPGALPIQIEVPDVEGLLRLVETPRILRVQGPGESVLRAVGNPNRRLVVPRRDDRQDGTEDLLLGDGRVGLDVGDDGRADEVSFPRPFLAPRHESPLALTRL